MFFASGARKAKGVTALSSERSKFGEKQGFASEARKAQGVPEHYWKA